MKKLRFFLILLCFAMLLPVMVSCGEKKPNVDKGDKYVYDDLTRETAADSIPDDYDLEFQTIAFFNPWTDDKAVYGDAESTDIIYSRIYERNLSVQERLSVKLEFVDSGATTWQDCSEVLKREIQAMSTAWEAVFAANNMVIQQKLFNYFHNLTDSEYIDVDERWWYTDAIKELAVDNFNYRFLYGDISIETLGKTGAMYYNKEAYEAYLSPNKNPDELYFEVLEGKWIFENFARLVKKSRIERGGDGSNDVYGYSLFGTGEELLFFQEAAGMTMYYRDPHGMPVIDLMNDKSVAFTNELYSLLYENEGAYIFYPGMGGGPREEHKYDFANGKVIFLLGNLNTAISDTMREMKADFGILPYPKWDEEQEEYRSLLHNSTVLVAAPVCADIDRVNEEVSAVIEALASESYRRVAVAYYETALKTTYNRDDYSAQMIDIITAQHDTIKSTLTKNFLYEYSWSLGGLGNIFKTLMNEKSTNFASKYDSLYYAYETNLTKLIQDYRAGTI